MNTNYLMKKKNFHLFYKYRMMCLVSRFIFPFLFVPILIWKQQYLVKTDEIRGLKQLFTPCFLLIGKKKSKINNYRIAHQKNHLKNNNDRTFS